MSPRAKVETLSVETARCAKGGTFVPRSIGNAEAMGSGAGA